MRALEVGAHLVEIDGDVVHIRWTGYVGLPDTEVIFRLASEVYDQYGYCLLLMDVGKSDIPEPDARKHSADWVLQRESAHVAVAFYGLSPVKQALASMMLNGINLLRRKHFLGAYFSSQSEARAWLADLRKQMPARPSAVDPDRAIPGRRPKA